MDEKCLVCGDKAIGKNFNVISCVSCKTLFRRNAFNYERFKCNFNNDCKIDVLRRRFCKRCRLRKCFDVGMKKEYILSEDERKMRQNLIQENRRKKQLISEITNDTTIDPTSHQTSSCDHSVEIFEHFLNTSHDFHDLNNNSNNQDHENPMIYEVSQHIYDIAVELEFSTPVPSITRPLSQANSFNDIEMNRLTELFNAININPLTKITSDYQMDIIENFVKNAITGTLVSRLFAIYLEQIVQKNVKMSKHIEAFGSLCASDQISLIKYGSIEICFLRSVLYYDFDYEYWTLILDTENSVLFNIDLFREYKKNTYYNHKIFLKKMANVWDLDNRIIDLMTAILLFNPDRPHLIHKEAVKFQQQVYMHLLHKYLKLKYATDCESRTRFLKLLNCLTDLYVMNDKIAKNLLDADPDKRMPLMNEICDRS